MARASDRTPGVRRRRQIGFAAVAAVPSVIDVCLLLALRQGAGLPLIVADAIAIGTASSASYGLHRLAADRYNPYARWTENPGAFVLVAVVAATVDIVVLRATFAATGYTSTAALLLAKAVALAVAATVRIIGYRLVLADVVRENRVLRPRPLEEREFRLTVVFPAFREPVRLRSTVPAVRDELQDIASDGGVEIIVVDDGSGDDTAAAAEESGADQVISLPRNSGKGAAVRAGVLAARGSVVCFTDADLAYHPRHLRDILSAIETGWDVAIGDRQHPDSQVLRQSGLRRLGSRLVNRISSIVLLDAPLDTQCGLKGFRSDVARAIFRQTRIDGFAFDIEVLHLVERRGWSLHRIPVELDESGAPSTVRVLRDTTTLVADMVRIRNWSSGGAYDALLEEAPGPATPS